MEYLLKRIANLNKVGINRYDRNTKTQICLEEHIAHNPIYSSAELRKKLEEGALSQKEPYIYKDKFEVCFAGICQEEFIYMIGPMSLKVFDWADTHQYYRFYEMEGDSEKIPVYFTFTEMLDIVEIVSKVILQKEYTDDELIYANRIVKDTKQQDQQEQVMYDIREDEEEFYHHTYKEERKLLDSVKEGRIEDALRYSRDMDRDISKLSDKEINHWKNVSIVAITLCTRAAIDGGISPSIAYRISDFYIKKSDGCNDIVRVIKYRDRAVEELTEQVNKKKKTRSSSYVEKCKNYIDKNYRKKILLAEISESLGISETYLSKLFKKETGMRLQDFIVDVRLERAANLLKYSDESISNIAEYVNFPSQSYMGKVFKEKYKITPKQFRELNQPAEFINKKTTKRTE